MVSFTGPIAQLLDELGRLPGIGPKSAQRLAFYLLERPRGEVERLASALVEARERVRRCAICCDWTDQEVCPICQDPRRDPSLICVVEHPKDVRALEKTGQFRGRYHVLHGALSPLDDVGPEDLTLVQLRKRLEEGGVQELIVATDPDMEGEATAFELVRLARPFGIKVTRLARGLPEGADLDYADDSTLRLALEGRREL
ncbi:MAG: recombination mediator RecR [Bacillota bacterium]|nr:recombination mediator RecR [Bacillota bacterium]